MTEIISHTSFFDYEAKYKDERTELILPAPIPQEVYNKALEYAATVYNVLGCRGLARCDFRFDDRKVGEGVPYGLCLHLKWTAIHSPGVPRSLLVDLRSFIMACLLAHSAPILVETASCQDPERVEQLS